MYGNSRRQDAEGIQNMSGVYLIGLIFIKCKQLYSTGQIIMDFSKIQFFFAKKVFKLI